MNYSDEEDEFPTYPRYNRTMDSITVALVGSALVIAIVGMLLLDR